MTLTVDDRELIERLRLEAKRTSEVSRMMAQSKSLRQAHDPPRDDLYMWSEPEQTTAWKAADRLQSLLSDRDKLEQLLERVWACRVNVQGRFVNLEKLWPVIDDIGVVLSQTEVS